MRERHSRDEWELLFKLRKEKFLAAEQAGRKMLLEVPFKSYSNEIKQSCVTSNIFQTLRRIGHKRAIELYLDFLGSARILDSVEGNEEAT